MNRYLLVLDSQNRLAFKKKLESQAEGGDLTPAFKKLNFVISVIEGKTFASALKENGIQYSPESAFITKRELKDQYFFTDKTIKELLGPPDRIENVKSIKNAVAHLYSKTRLQSVLETQKYKDHAEKVKQGREKRQATQRVPKDPIARASQSTRILDCPSDYRAEKSAKEKLKQLVSKLRKNWDLNEYKDFFPNAREMKRKHTFFVGPTNSGKSYRGFNELVLGSSGVYLSPLRLLALEGQEEIEKRGKECSLLTGEEMEIKPGAQFIASTIEMANLEKRIDCALIDEVQLILDKNRGWAWSQAIVGIPAERIIMTGSSECTPTLKRLIEDYLEEELEIIPLDRIGKLEIHDRPTFQLNRIEAGTAVIAFSRRGVLAYKKELEDKGKKVSVLYGNLSPGVRREEAKRFRSGETEVLVATDCIGMGLNLPIKTIIFSETSKFDGKESRNLNPQEVKQIAGRAGRYGKFECGYAGAMSNAELKLLRNHIHSKNESILESCVVRPTETQLEVLREQIGDDNIKSALSLFNQLSKVNSVLICSNLTEMIELAGHIEMRSELRVLPFKDKYIFICAPVSSTEVVMEKYFEWLVSYSRKTPVVLRKADFSQYPSHGSTNEDHFLNHAENCVKMLTLYHWIARKKPEYFPSRGECDDLREQINNFIENSLKKKGLHRKCLQCSKRLPVHHVYKICNECFRSRSF